MGIAQSVLRGAIQLGMYIAYRPKVKYQNADLMRSDEPVVFICNHMSHMDGPLVASVLHLKSPYFLIARDYYEKPQYHPFLETYGAVPVDRSGMDTTWFEACRNLLEEGHSILIFPEGHTSTGELDEFQPGFAVLAEKTGAKIVECVNAGQYHKFFGPRKFIYVGDGYTIECPSEIRKSIYAKQIASTARDRIQAKKIKIERRMRKSLKYTHIVRR